MEKVSIVIDGKTYEYEKGTSFKTIADQFQAQYDAQIAVCIFNGKIRELVKKADKDGTLEFVTVKESIGHKTYIRTATMMMLKALYDVLGRKHIGKAKIEFAIGDAYYCSINSDVEITEELVKRINERMNYMVIAAMSIIKKSYPVDDAVELFEKQGMQDKIKMMKFRRSSVVNVYALDGYYDYYYGYMLPDCGYVKYFNVFSYEKGVMLLLPARKEPNKLQFFKPREKLFNTLMQSTILGEKMGIDTVGDLNNKICEGKIYDVIRVQEALQERRIAEIAQDIVDRKDVKFVMIAGPSSSGKTTFSHRLSTQLSTHGMTPHPIAIDNYFVNRDKTPRDENGDYNFECLEAIDTKQFNQDMCDLLEGKTVELPYYNFKTGRREYKGNYLTLGPEDVLVIEGIHGLNDKMSYALPHESKYKVYISALTSMNVDEHNRIPTTDGRLIRRMVRDARTRGTSAKGTLQMWPSVRRGEEENIFPFQEDADAMFNSALVYELAVLKVYAEPLLYSIEPGDAEYFEARRLLKFFEYFLGVSSDKLPNNSICREFVGGSCFDV